MPLTRELLLSYPGFHGLGGLAHVRVYGQPGRLPAVIAGQLDDNPGTSITNRCDRTLSVKPIVAPRACRLPRIRG